MGDTNMKFQHTKATYITGSIKGVSDEEQEICSQTIYYYIRIIINGQIYYYGNDGNLTDQSCAKVFTEKESRIIARKLNEKYDKVIIFSTSKKL